jgi:hypothetical protein
MNMLGVLHKHERDIAPFMTADNITRHKLIAHKTQRTMAKHVGHQSIIFFQGSLYRQKTILANPL